MANDDTRITPVFDWINGEFVRDAQGNVLTAAGFEAVQQVIIKAQQTPRGEALIYADLDNPDINHKYGSDVQATLRSDLDDAAKLSELKRNVRDALIYDPWITDVSSVTITRAGTEITADFEAEHIYGSSKIEGVSINT